MTKVNAFRFTTPDVSPHQSVMLRKVDLRVSPKRWGTCWLPGQVPARRHAGHHAREEPGGGVHGPLPGGLGGTPDVQGQGPLGHHRWVRGFGGLGDWIGTVHGGGYDCKMGKTNTIEGSDNGVWNRVRIRMEITYFQSIWLYW